jgi:hypothetical protein
VEIQYRATTIFLLSKSWVTDLQHAIMPCSSVPAGCVTEGENGSNQQRPTGNGFGDLLDVIRERRDVLVSTSDDETFKARDLEARVLITRRGVDRVISLTCFGIDAAACCSLTPRRRHRADT